MTYYAGPQVGNERPKGGGSYNKEKVGHEVFNFADFGGQIYGFVQAKNGRINLERIDPAVGQREKLDDVLVIFVATQRIIGWYQGATVHRTTELFPASVTKEMRKRLKQAPTKPYKIKTYGFDIPTSKAILLPTLERTHEIPGNVKGGFGQSNVCYVYEDSGVRKSAAWINDAVSYVLNYDKENLLKNPNAENESDEAATISQEQAAGFQSNMAIRNAIENYAMLRTPVVLTEKGYGNFKNTAKFKPYDYTCERNGKTFFVEVKGTQTRGKTVILTRGEVKHVSSNGDSCILVLVHSINVTGKKNVHVSGGTADIRESWQLRSEALSPLQYVWTVE